MAADGFLLKLLIVHDALVDEAIEAADPFRFVFQLRVGEEPLVVFGVGDEDDLFDVVQVLIKPFLDLLDGRSGFLPYSASGISRRFSSSVS